MCPPWVSSAPNRDERPHLPTSLSYAKVSFRGNDMMRWGNDKVDNSSVLWE